MEANIIEDDIPIYAGYAMPDTTNYTRRPYRRRTYRRTYRTRRSSYRRKPVKKKRKPTRRYGRAVRRRRSGRSGRPTTIVIS